MSEQQRETETFGQTGSVPVRSSSNTLSIVSFVLSAIAVIFLPIIFGVAAIICGAVAVGRKERLGTTALVVSIVATILGFVLGYLVLSNS